MVTQRQGKDEAMSNERSSATAWLRAYRWTGLSLAVIFTLVGLIFLFWPRQVVQLFNSLSPMLGFSECAAVGSGFFVILATAYMYLVSLLALQMYRQPEPRVYPWLLIQAKTASALLSFVLFLFASPCLIYFSNALIDGSIALGIFLLLRHLAKGRP